MGFSANPEGLVAYPNLPSGGNLEKYKFVGLYCAGGRLKFSLLCTLETAFVLQLQGEPMKFAFPFLLVVGGKSRFLCLYDYYNTYLYDVVLAFSYVQSLLCSMVVPGRDGSQELRFVPMMVCISRSNQR